MVVITALDHNHNPIVFKSKKIICAVPIATSKNITFTNISIGKQLIFDNQVKTKTQKTFMFFKRPFWRKYKANGDGLFCDEWAVNMCHDISPQD